MKNLAILILAAFLGSSAQAFESDGNVDLTRRAFELGFQNSEELKSYFEIKEFTVTENEIEFSPEELAFTGITIANGTANDAGGGIAGSIGSVLADLGLELGDVKSWITVGLKIWDVIKANQPVLNVQTKTVSVLPLSQPNWQQMETWKGPQAKSYTLQAKNLYGVVVVSHTYTVAFHYGGSLDGRGQFLANATIIPTNVNVMWGFTLNSDVKVGDPLNSGTKADPIPGIGLGLEWAMSSFLKKQQGRDQFYVRGDGTTSHFNEL